MSAVDPGPGNGIIRRRWTKYLLIGSLAINLAVVGLVAGFLLRAPDKGPHPMNLPIEGFRAIAEAMPAAERDALRAAYREKRREIGATRRSLKALDVAFFEALRAEGFTSDQLTQVLDDRAEVWQRFGDTARAVLISRIAEMTPEDRVAFADRLEMTYRKDRRPKGPGRD